MKVLAKSFLLSSLLFTALLSRAQTPEVSSAEKMQWFQDAKLGIFIHWGIYASKGVSESWSFFNNYLNHESYMQQLDGFNARNYDPAAWVQLIKESGARYTVITSKHHDGVSLWDTKQPNAITTLKNSAAKRDVLSPFVAEVKKAGLRTGIYFSLPDWSYPDYDVFTRIQKRYDLKQEPARFGKFQRYMLGQLNEISLNFKPDILWFDGDWEHSAEEWKAKDILGTLRKYNKNIIINSRLNGHGDYDTPEQGIPVLAPANPYWELNYTMNDSWGYQATDQNYKSSNMIIRTLVDCLGNGGNFLLDIGPKADGSIPEPQVQILKDLGRWTKKHAAAIYGTRRGLPAGHFYGKTSLSQDRKTLYLYLDEQQPLAWLRGIASDVASVQVVGGGSLSPKFTRTGNDIVVDLRNATFDKDVTVVSLEFKEPLTLTSPEVPVLSINDFLGKSSLSASMKLEQLALNLHQGHNIFSGSGLAPDGLNFKPQVRNVDADMLRWTIKHAEALYKTGKGLPAGHFDGPSVLSEDKQTVYLFVKGKPTGPIALKGVKNAIARIRVVGDGRMINHSTFNKLYWSAVPGINYIDIPDYALDKDMTIIAVLLQGPLDLYREKVGAIESNL